MNIFYRLILIVGIVGSTQTLAKESMVYSGSYEADIKTVNAANNVNLTIVVWEGYDRNFEITLTDIDVPEAFEDAPDCHIQLMADAMKFTKKFLRNAEELKVYGIRMEDSAKKYGTAEIKSEKAMLSKELLKKGFARSNTIANETPWCEDEK
ncbi:MAG: thermonuclease family protein [Alcanivoracaceae bacterium]|nr:thermonuclease family protein [Alcanivoracaceae bacterium]